MRPKIYDKYWMNVYPWYEPSGLENNNNELTYSYNLQGKSYLTPEEREESFNHGSSILSELWIRSLKICDNPLQIFFLAQPKHEHWLFCSKINLLLGLELFGAVKVVFGTTVIDSEFLKLYTEAFHRAVDFIKSPLKTLESLTLNSLESDHGLPPLLKARYKLYKLFLEWCGHFSLRAGVLFHIDSNCLAEEVISSELNHFSNCTVHKAYL